MTNPDKMKPMVFTVEDAITHRKVELTITPDNHGFVLDVKADPEFNTVIVDFAGGNLRVFQANAFGDVVDEPVAAFEV